MQTEDIEIKIDHVTHCYGTQKALDDVCLELSGHNTIGLLGANGAGKSTLMNIICGVLTPTSGSVSINGYTIASSPEEAKQRLGFLPQKPPLLPDLSIEEYLRYAARLREVKDERRAVERAMEKCGITHFRKRLIKNLSGGYQQRVGIAQAIIHTPSFIVLDEPTNGLDPTQIIEIRKLIEEISSNCMVLLSTHILHEVQMCCRQIIMIAHGQTVFDGSIETFNGIIKPTSVLLTGAALPSHERLVRIPGVTGSEILPDRHDTVRISFSGDSDTVCENLVRASVEEGWMLHEIVKETPSADDIFEYLSNSPAI